MSDPYSNCEKFNSLLQVQAEYISLVEEQKKILLERLQEETEGNKTLRSKLKKVGELLKEAEKQRMMYLAHRRAATVACYERELHRSRACYSLNDRIEADDIDTVDLPKDSIMNLYRNIPDKSLLL